MFVSISIFLQSYVDQATRLLLHGVPVHGMGVQGHFRGTPNMAAIAVSIV
jgi:GH35 family endo-1,4-beta-xylanase